MYHSSFSSIYYSESSYSSAKDFISNFFISFYSSLSFYSIFLVYSSSSSSSSSMTSNLRIAATPVIFLSFYPEGCRLENITTSPPKFLTAS
jgi:hypothetical protein